MKGTFSSNGLWTEFQPPADGSVNIAIAKYYPEYVTSVCQGWKQN